MHLILHRVNTVAGIARLDPRWGAECDVRSIGEELVLSHDPFTRGERLDDFAAAWAREGRRGTLVLNAKEDGIERAAADCLRRQGVTDYFLVDLPAPALVRVALRERSARVAARVSEYEAAEDALRFAGAAEWAWIDCFTGKPPDAGVVRALRARFRVCLVSPELHGFGPAAIETFRPLVPLCDAVCTKFPERWAS